MNFVIQSTFQKSNTLNWTLGISTSLFVLLFHQASIGLNLSIFTLLLIGYWFFSFQERFDDWQVSTLAFATFITMGANAWYGSPDTILWSILSLMLLSQQIYYPQSSLLFAETKAFLNIFFAPIQGLSNSFNKKASDEASAKSKMFYILLFIILPLSFAALFANIYSQLNPIFENVYANFTENIDFQLILTASLGLVVAVILLKPIIPEKLLDTDRNLTNNFKASQLPLSENAILERTLGIVLFSLLNLTLLIFLVSDIFFVNEIANGSQDNHSKYVHQGVGLLIFSIILASAFILFFFRSATTALLPTRDWLKILALIWIALNIGILITTAAKNAHYISGYSLTLKRIGVFIYLSLAVAGLVITLAKIAFGKTNAFIFRNLYWSFFLILTVNICLDWSRFTTRYNLNNHIQTDEPLDWQYLLSLDKRNLPIIASQRNKIRFASEWEKEQFQSRLYQEAGKLKRPRPDWREIKLARIRAQSNIRWK